mgnify:FL=1
MNRWKLSILLIFVILWGSGCASHPPVLPKEITKGDTHMGFTFSIENVIPVAWVRRGLNQYTDVGLRVGLPLSGSGIDINRILFRKDRKWDALNLAYNIAPNSSIDFTYYKFKQAKKTKKGKSLGVSWRGYCGMYIPEGVSKGESLRFGFLYGRRIGEKYGIELGYFHDFRSIPIKELFTINWDPYEFDLENDTGYENYEHKYNGFPSEYSRLTGLSFQLFMYLGQMDKKE